MPRGRVAREERGFALLLVLWSLILISLIITQLLSAGRQETQLASNLRQAAVAESIADSAVQDTIFHLLTNPAPLGADGAHVLTMPGGSARISLRDAAGMINPNIAPQPLLTALLQSCGASAGQAAQLTQAITDWRSPANDMRPLINAYRASSLAYAPQGQPFQAPDEIRLVVGMKPALADCVVPQLSVYADQEMPLLMFAGPLVRTTLLRMMRATGQAVPMVPPDPHAARVVEITAEGHSHDARFIRRAIVRLGGSDPATPFRILTWQDGS